MINYTDTFGKEAKKLFKKNRLIKDDIQEAVKEIEEKEDIGTPLGSNLYKKRVANSSIPTGKSGGFRIIIYSKIKEEYVFLTIYSKKDMEDISDEELSKLIKEHL